MPHFSTAQRHTFQPTLHNRDGTKHLNDQSSSNDVRLPNVKVSFSLLFPTHIVVSFISRYIFSTIQKYKFLQRRRTNKLSSTIPKSTHALPIRHNDNAIPSRHNDVTIPYKDLSTSLISNTKPATKKVFIGLFFLLPQDKTASFHILSGIHLCLLC